ncbi:MAG: ATPase [Phenylobacterium sp.]|nr:MAG: ATPase [Phenylobacterium sp.]
MSQTITPAPIRKTLSVRAPPEKAFEVFTAGIDRWWPRTHHIGKAELGRAVLEPRNGGRWYEVGVDGSECEWGEVLLWEPPRRLMLAWHITAQFTYDPDGYTEVDIRFTDAGDGTTRIDFEHRGLERLGAEAGSTIARMDSGWGQILGLFLAAAEA